MIGTVKFYNESKGIFVHATALHGTQIKEGDKVSYEEEEGRKGTVAGQIQVL